MQRRDFIASAGTAAALASAVRAYAQPGQTIPNKPMDDMHAPKYKPVEQSSSACVASGEDCLRHAVGMWSMKDTSMAASANAIMQLVAVCQSLHTLAALNSPFTVDFAKTTAAVCDAAAKECQPFYAKYPECKACSDDCSKCAVECRKLISATR
jgi:Cys-rich four helix bundle protein (predicted Tat secretion target)